MEPILKADSINVYYGSIHAIKDVSFEVFDGEIVTLIGANRQIHHAQHRRGSAAQQDRLGDLYG